MRLATANRSRVSIRGRQCKIFFTSSLITVQNLVVKIWMLFLILNVSIQKAQKFGCAMPVPLGGGVAHPMLLPTSCVIVSNFVDEVQTVWAYLGCYQKLGTLGPSGILF